MIKFSKDIIAPALAAAVLGLTAADQTRATTVYEAQSIIGNGGGAYSFLHTATSNPMNPNGNHKQYANGTVFAMLDAQQTFQVTHEDLGAPGIGVGDTLSINAMIDVLNFSGNPFNNATAGSKIGAIELNGTLTLGGASSNLHQYGVSGTLDFQITFTDAPSRQPSPPFAAGDVVTGTYFFQAAAFTNRFNGADIDSENLTVSLWGDSRNPQGQITSTLHRDGATLRDEPLGIDWVLVGQAVQTPPQSTTPVPAPASAGLIVAAMIGLIARRSRG